MVEENLKGQATYWGGHFLHPGSQLGDNGNFYLVKDKIVFEKTALLGRNRWVMEIPLNKVIWKKISQETGEDVAYKAKMSAMSYFATGKPVSTYTRNVTFVTIPFKDERGVQQNPKFTFGNQKFLEQISAFFYEKMSAKK